MTLRQTSLRSTSATCGASLRSRREAARTPKLRHPDRHAALGRLPVRCRDWRDFGSQAPAASPSLGAGGAAWQLAIVVRRALITLAAAFVVVYNETGTQVQAQIDRSIKGAAIEMDRAVTDDEGSSTSALLAAAAPRYVRFTAATARHTGTAVPDRPGIGTALRQSELFGHDYER